MTVYYKRNFQRIKKNSENYDDNRKKKTLIEEFEDKVAERRAKTHRDEMQTNKQKRLENHTRRSNSF